MRGSALIQLEFSCFLFYSSLMILNSKSPLHVAGIIGYSNCMLHPEITKLATAMAEADVHYWLIGGQAIELLCGGRVREHDDIDFMVRHADIDKASKVLIGLDFHHAHGSTESGNIFFRREELLVDLVPMLEEPPRSIGKFKEIKWPVYALKPFLLQFAGVEIQTLTPTMHREMKSLIAKFYGIPLRAKDLVDLEALERCRYSESGSDVG